MMRIAHYLLPGPRVWYEVTEHGLIFNDDGPPACDQPPLRTLRLVQNHHSHPCVDSGSPITLTPNITM